MVAATARRYDGVQAIVFSAVCHENAATQQARYWVVFWAPEKLMALCGQNVADECRRCHNNRTKVRQCQLKDIAQLGVYVFQNGQNTT